MTKEQKFILDEIYYDIFVNKTESKWLSAAWRAKLKIHKEGIQIDDKDVDQLIKLWEAHKKGDK